MGREALSHLYDTAFLSRHPLAGHFTGSPDEPPGQALHRVLLETIEQLRPPGRVPPTASAWRPYLALSLRYTEERTTQQIAQEIGVSLRQLRREHARGIQMFMDLLWERLQQAHPAGAETSQSGADVDSEVARLSEIRSETLTAPTQVIRSVIDTLERLAAARHVDLDVRLPEQLPRVPVERTALRQILLNVLTHMIESDGIGPITITASRKGSELTLQVQRNLTHHDAASLPSAEDRLSVAQRLLDGQGGRLIRDEADAGLCRLVLPVRAAPGILVVDDNQEMIQLFRRYLAASRYEVIGATSAQDGIRLAEELHPSLIILDVMIPDQDGWEVLQHLRNMPSTKDIPVVICSVLKEQELAFSLGASEFLAKPVSQQDLLRVVSACQSPR